MRNLLVLTAAAGLICAGCQKKDSAQVSIVADPSLNVPSPGTLEPVDAAPAAPTAPPYMASDDIAPAPTASLTPLPPPAESALPPVTPLAPPGRRTYIIQKGDTLYGIARREYGDGKRWKEIAAVNPGIEPTRLRIGAEIILPSR